MEKLREIQDASSCFNKAKDNERIFVLLARDEAAPDTIRYWINRRIKSGKNAPDDPIVLEALKCARKMEIERAEIRRSLHK